MFTNAITQLFGAFLNIKPIVDDLEHTVNNGDIF